MGTETGQKKTLLKERITDQIDETGFIELLRILRKTMDVGSEEEFRNRVRIRPELSLDFPSSDMSNIEFSGDDKIVIDATFLGLYGASSPLPSFYTEELIEEMNDGFSTSREFIDIFNNPLYHMLYRSWVKYKLPIAIFENERSEIQDRVYAFVGLSGKSVRSRFSNPYGVIKYAGLITQNPRSSEGLRAIVSEHLGVDRVCIEECVSRKVDIPQDQRCFVGLSSNMLGEMCTLGSEIEDINGKFRIKVNIDSSESFYRALPYSDAYKELEELIEFYLDFPLVWDVEIDINGDFLECVRLGCDRWSTLGYDSWLGSEAPTKGSVLIDPQYEQRKKIC